MSHRWESLMKSNIPVLSRGGKRALSAVLSAVGLSLLAIPCPGAPAQPLGERDFRLSKNGSELVVFPVTEAGTLVVKVRITKPFARSPVRLLLEGPGGLRVEKEGFAPLRLRYTVANATAGETWRALVINVGRLPDLTGKLTVELRSPQGSAPLPLAGDPIASETKANVTNGTVSFIDDRRLRAVCRDRNPDVSVRLDLELGTGALLMRFNYVFSFAARQTSEDRIEMRGSGQHPLYLDLVKQAIVFASGEQGIFCQVRIYRQGEE